MNLEGVVDYDIVYYTQNDSEEDRLYFNNLRIKACRSQYCYCVPKKIDILNHLFLYLKSKKWVLRASHSKIIFCNIDTLFISAIVARKRCELVTFDDGVANFLSSGRYRLGVISNRVRFYQIIFGALSVEKIKKRIIRHYTLYPNLQNIVDRHMLLPLSGFAEESDRCSTSTKRVNVFIGQPFHEALSYEQILLLKKHIRRLDIDLYIKHPRELVPLDPSIPLAKKNGRLAEEVILSLDNPRVYGWFSAVLLNLPESVERTMLLFDGDKRTAEIVLLCKSVGCNVCYVN